MIIFKQNFDGKVFNKINQLILSIFILIVIFACSGNDDNDDASSNSTLGQIDSELVGTWVGEVDGSFGKADMTMVLQSNGNMTAGGSTALYCPMAGKWGVKSNNFKVEAKDNCDGTSVGLNASRSITMLSGNWSASSGNSGTFTVTKQ